MDIQYYLVGDTIISGGETGKDVYVILDGQAQVTSVEDGKILAHLGAGEHFGEVSLILSEDAELFNHITNHSN